MSKELRKALRGSVEGIRKERLALESILTDENKEILREHPCPDGKGVTPKGPSFER